jgi:hypothetical protein
MNGLAALPILPRSAARGLPQPTELFTLGLRRRYAFTLACALVGEPSWVIVVHPQWKVSQHEVQRIMESGWPAVGSAQAVAVIQPAAMPEDPAELFARAVLAAGDLGEGVEDLLVALWAGLWPEGVGAELEAMAGEAIFRAGMRATAEAEGASAGQSRRPALPQSQD